MSSDPFTIDDPAALRTALHPLRRRIAELLRAPLSVRELAEHVQLPADRLYYHLNLLIAHGLVHPAGVRRRGGRDERLYARTPVQLRFSGDLDVRGANPLTAIADELGPALGSAPAGDVASLSWHTVRLVPLRAAQLAERMRALIAEYEGTPDAQGPRYGVLGAVGALPRGDDITMREFRPEEIGFLHDMLIAALAWRPEVELPPRERVLAHPQVIVFHEGWGRRGDVGIVAESGGELVGLVWYRSFTAESHGEGYIDDATPELAIAVAEGHRGRGIGRSLMLAAHERARADGLARLSLSVDSGNPARRLYASLGYTDYEPGDGLGRMVLALNGDDEVSAEGSP